MYTDDILLYGKRTTTKIDNSYAIIHAKWKYLRPYLSERVGMNRHPIAKPEKYDIVNELIKNLEAHIKSNSFIQLSNDIGSSQSIDHFI